MGIGVYTVSTNTVGKRIRQSAKRSRTVLVAPPLNELREP